LAFFQRALAAAAIFARLAALILRLTFFTGFVAGFRPLTQVRNERKETDFFREVLRHNPLRGRGWCVAEAM
jgi:hypothetical protein